MGQTYWYAYDKTGEVSGPYFDTREKAAEACGDGEVARPVSADVVDTDDDAGGVEPYEQLDHDELKAEAEERGIAEETDLRSKEAIVEALREYDQTE